MERVFTIPKEDLEAINRSFEYDQNAQTISKDPSGNKIKAEKKGVNEVSHVFESFGGRVLRQQKSVIPIGGSQILVGVKGTRYDDIPKELRDLVAWFESDFE